MPRPKLDPSVIEDIERMIRTGSDPHIIADECGVGRETVRRVRRRMGVPPMRRDYSEKSKEAVELVRQGYSYGKAAMELGIWPTTVQRACRALGVKSAHPNTHHVRASKRPR